MILLDLVHVQLFLNDSNSSSIHFEPAQTRLAIHERFTEISLDRQAMGPRSKIRVQTVILLDAGNGCDRDLQKGRKK